MQHTNKLAENGVLAIKVLACTEGDEELGLVFSRAACCIQECKRTERVPEKEAGWKITKKKLLRAAPETLCVPTTPKAYKKNPPIPAVVTSQINEHTPNCNFPLGGGGVGGHHWSLLVISSKPKELIDHRTFPD